MVKGWQIYTYDRESGEWYYYDSHVNAKLLAEACNELGLRNTQVQIREVHTNGKND